MTMYEQGERDAEAGVLIANYEALDSNSKSDYEEGYCNKAWEMGADDSKFGHGKRDLGHFKLREAKLNYHDGYTADEEGWE